MTSPDDEDTADLKGSDSSSMDALFCAVGSETTALSEDDLRHHLHAFLDTLGEREDVLLLPPDFTRFPSHAGIITQIISEYFNFTKKPATKSTDPPPEKVAKTEPRSADCIPKIQIMPALGTHAPMSEHEIRKMFGDALADKQDPSPFLVHDWRNDVVTIGEAPASMVKAATWGMVDKPWPAQLNRLVWSKRKSLQDVSKQKHASLVLSIGQVVPHEVVGMANFNKNLFVGMCLYLYHAMYTYNRFSSCYKRFDTRRYGWCRSDQPQPLYRYVAICEFRRVSECRICDSHSRIDIPVRRCRSRNGTHDGATRQSSSIYIALRQRDFLG